MTVPDSRGMITHGHFHRNSPTHADQAETFGERVMAFVTDRVGTLACALLFLCIALVSLPSAIQSGSLIIIVGWIAQTFLQLVLLSIILGGQKVQSKAADAQTAHIAAGVDTILERLPRPR